MALPPEVDKIIHERLEYIVTEAQTLAKAEEKDDGYLPAELRSNFHAIKQNFISVINFLSQRANLTLLLDEVNSLNSNGLRVYPNGQLLNTHYQTGQLLGLIRGLKNDYETGMIDSLTRMIEANVTGDYLGQAEQLLKEGQPGKYDHVPAAVLTGAILEDALRRLCQRQNPPIPVDKPNGEPKTLNPLIDDLKKANVFNELKAKQLRSWADIRNAAAHGDFTAFNRQDVEQMLPSVQNFLADYL